MADHALGQVVGLDLVGDRQLLQAGHQAPVTADDPPYQTGVAQVVEAAVLAVPLTGRINQCQIPRLTFLRQGGGVACQIHLFDGDGDALRESDANETASGDSIPITDETHRFGGRQDFAAPGRQDAAQYGMSDTLRHDFSPP